ncbi:hypothetical protein [Candidatus Contubernalis alkaliaceticus]|uniref:hypothetical protein n=1 Tax=Candidatus Contubernalis alkaliaceticus TaxID=338645 RepID=UPI001F4C3F9E|nr:hypothetical protein [Candidatus Contubernalis alkalaceticus]UNC92129.1 hypothetical protein HUE98_08475 [Candidatus Contubernalis alkalaceticus]
MASYNFLYITIFGQLLIHLRIMLGRTYRPYPLLWASLLMPLIFGILLRLPSLIERWNSNHKFNWSKSIYQGIPALILVFLSHPFSVMLFGNIIPIYSVQRQLFMVTEIKILAAIWLGVVVTDSIKCSQES